MNDKIIPNIGLSSRELMRQEMQKFADPLIEQLKGKTFEEIDLIIQCIRSSIWKAEEKIMKGKRFK